MAAAEEIVRLKNELQQTQSERDRLKYELDTMHIKYSTIYDKIKHGTYKIICHLKNEVQRLTISKLSLIQSTALEMDKLRQIIGLLSRGEKVDDDIFKNYNNNYSQQQIFNDSLPPNTPNSPPSDFSWKDTLNIDLSEKDIELINIPNININELNERRIEQIRQEEQTKLAIIKQQIKDEFDSKLNIIKIQIEQETEERLKSDPDLIASIKHQIIQQKQLQNNNSINIIKQQIKDEFDSKLNMIKIQIEHETEQRLKSDPDLIASIKNQIIQQKQLQNNNSININEQQTKLAIIEQQIKDEFDSKLNMIKIQIEHETEERLKSDPDLIASIKNQIIQQQNNNSININESIPPPPPQNNDNSNISIPPPPGSPAPPPLDDEQKAIENIASNDNKNDMKSPESEIKHHHINHRKRSSRMRIDRNPYKPPKSVQDEMDQSLFDEDDMINNFSPNPLAKKEEINEEEELIFDDENNDENNDEEKENEDWQIMGDLLFSIRHSLINSESNNVSKVSKPHLDITRNEWSSFTFEEYAPLLFYTLRSQWLKSDFLSSKYVKDLFGEESESLKVQDLDINKSCKYYWRRLNTNSKSGQIFFQSVNGEYIIKSMPKSEAEFLRKSFLDKYCDHMLREQDSLLMHIMGCYKIQYKEDKKMSLASNNEYNSKRAQDVNKGVYVMVMKSILFCDVTPAIIQHKIYDLKGSTHNRTASRYKLNLDKITFDALTECDSKTFQHEINYIENVNENTKQIFKKYSGGFYVPKENGNETGKLKQDTINQKQGVISVYKRSKVLKDLDFVGDEEILNIGQELKNKYVKQLRVDLDFLCKMNVMDYSLLVGIHRSDFNVFCNNISSKEIIEPTAGNMFTFKFGGMCNNKESDDEKINIYFTGIIDFLQEYNTKKKMESMYKRVKYDGKDAISSVDAKTYANRLYEFIEKKMI